MLKFSRKIKKIINLQIWCVSNPEFLREGEAIEILDIDRVVIGSNNLKKIKPILEKLYEPIIKKG